jgi:hypothetical protein
LDKVSSFDAGEALRRSTSFRWITYAQHPISRRRFPTVGGLPFVGPAFLDSLSQCSLYGDHHVRFNLAGNLNCQPMGGRCEGWLRSLRRTPHISVDLWSTRGRCGCIKMACLFISQALRAAELGRYVPGQAFARNQTVMSPAIFRDGSFRFYFSRRRNPASLDLIVRGQFAFAQT